MNYFLAFQNTYEHVEIGLFSFQPALVAKKIIFKKDASRDIIPCLDNFLSEQSLTIQNFPFLVANQGPGPFTTLRVVITTVNGLSFATGIPLIGIDALTAAQQEWADPSYIYTIILFNAFAFDVYFLIEKEQKVLFQGYKNIDLLLDELKKKNEPIRFMGNGASLYCKKIKNVLGNHAYIPEPTPNYCSLERIGLMGYMQWNNGYKGTPQLFPLYLKNHQSQKTNT